MDEIKQQFIEYAITIGAIELIPEGRRLKSGRLSPYFFNSGLFNTGKTFNRLMMAYFNTIEGGVPQIIYGPAYKGIPLAVGLAQYASQHGYDFGYAFNRKEEKDHGEGGIISGASVKGKDVLIIDDVMTTGTSFNEAMEIVKANGGNPISACIAFDRQEQGKDSQLSAVQEFKKNHGIPVYSAVNLDNLITYLYSKKTGNDHLEVMFDKIIKYKEVYGAAPI